MLALGMAEIEKESVDDIKIHSLVGDYLKFHGYNKTYEKFC